MNRKPLSAIICALLAAALFLPSCSKKYVMEYKGHGITENMYHYWVSTYKRNILLSYSDAYDTAEFWGREYSDGMTVKEYFDKSIRDRITDYLIAEVLFREMRLSLDASVKKAINDDISEKIEYYGGRKALNGELANINLDVSTLKSIYTMEKKYAAVYEKLTGDGGAIAPTVDDVAAYYAENYSRIKYIVFYTTALVTDENGNQLYDDIGRPLTAELSETELAEKEEKIAECMRRAKTGEEFSALAAEYSEYDTSAYKNGFYISFNEINTWGEQIISGAKDAGENDVFRVDEEYAVYVVVKLPLTPLGELEDSDISQLSSLNTYVCREKAEEYFSSLHPFVTVSEEALAACSVSDVKTNPYYGF